MSKGKKIRVPSDVIVYILSFLRAKMRFEYDARKIHIFFYGLSREDKFSELFKDFIFDESRQFPYCATISYAFNRLFKSELLKMIGSYAEECEITKVLAKKDPTELFFFQEINLLKEAADRFISSDIKISEKSV